MRVFLLSEDIQLGFALSGKIHHDKIKSKGKWKPSKKSPHAERIAPLADTKVRTIKPGGVLDTAHRIH